MFARTERLILRPSWPEDAAPLAKALSNPDIARNLLNVPAHYDETEAHRWIERQRDPRLPEFLSFMRTRGGASRLVGGVAISRRADGELELGYWVERSLWGLGFATEATRAVMRIARATGLIVRAGHFLDNPSSARVLRKIGFRPTGRVESRVSRGRASEVSMALFEYDESLAPPRDEPAFELYRDAMPAMA
ncbi:MAG TPA: GNAT family N-acetyltransferase [Sphingobium sp.]